MKISNLIIEFNPVNHMNKPQKNFMLEIILNVIFLSFGLFLAFYLLLLANKTHQENLALSKIQAEMMNISETLTSTSSLSPIMFDASGNRTSQNPIFTIYLNKEKNDHFNWISISLKDDEGLVITSWDVGVTR